MKMRFSVGDLVTERRTNYWHFHSYGYGFRLRDIHDYWDDYYNNVRFEPYVPTVGIIIRIDYNDANSFYTETYNTYRVWWINCPVDEQYMMQRSFYGDELRLLSKINNVGEKE